MEIVHFNQRQLAARWCISEVTPAQVKTGAVAAVFHRWLLAQRLLVPPGSATTKAKAIDYCLNH